MESHTLMADPWRKAETIGAGRPTIQGALDRARYGDPLAEPVIRASTPVERGWDWVRGIWDAIKDNPATRVGLMAAGSSPEEQERRWTEPPPEVALGATDRSLAAMRLARAFAKDPRSLRDTMRVVPGGYEARAPIISRMEDALEVGRGRPADWDLRPFEAAAGSPEELTRIARTYGAVSPGTGFVDSLVEMYKSLLMRHRGQALTPDALRGAGFGMTRSKAPNLNRAFADEPLLSIDQKYPGKTEDLSQLMLGADRWVPDRHAFTLTGQGHEANIRALLSELRGDLMRVEGRKLNPGETYQRFVEAMRRGMAQAAGREYGQGTFPMIWEGIRGARGEPYQRGIAEIMRDVGSHAPGALVDPAHLESVVRRGLVRRAAKVR